MDAWIICRARWPILKSTLPTSPLGGFNREFSIDELRIATTKLAAFIEKNKVTHLDVDDDLYWFIGNSELFQVEDQQNEMTTGAISDDVEHLRQTANGSRPPTPQALYWLGALFRANGIKMGK